MPKLTIVAFDGTRFDLDVDQGSTVMENAVRNSVPGIEAECGGACACATCHVYVDEEWTEKVGQPEAMEEDMLDFAFDVRPTSRLSCQIRMKAVYDGSLCTCRNASLTRAALQTSPNNSISKTPRALERARRGGRITYG